MELARDTHASYHVLQHLLLTAEHDSHSEEKGLKLRSLTGEQVLKSALELKGSMLVTVTLVPLDVALTVDLVA